jgi:ABC-type sugar transport system permease subunit
MQQLSTMPDTLKAKRASGLSRRSQDNLMIALFLAPALILFLIFVIYPIFRSMYFSLFNWNGMGPAVNFVGLDNFKAILNDKVFIKAIGTSSIIVFSVITVAWRWLWQY